MGRIDTSKWKAFTVGSLFYKLNLKIIKENFNKTMDVSTARTSEFSLPLVNAKHFDNGIMYYGRECDFESAEMTLDVVKNGAIATGDVYAQPQKTGVLWDAYLIKPFAEITSERVLLYLATVLEKSIKDKFSYDDKCIWEKVRKLTIMLPVDENHQPDFSYMESYMKNQEIAVSASLTKLQSAKRFLKSRNAEFESWKTYKIKDIFPNIVKPAVYHTREVKENPEGIPYVVRSKFNNGVKYYVERPNSNVNHAKVISFGAENATFFYQKSEWISGRDMYYIDTRGIDEYACLFITSCLQPIAEKYSYNYGMFPDLLKEERIKLPANKNGDPDYAFMEKYMRIVENKVYSAVKVLSAV